MLFKILFPMDLCLDARNVTREARGAYCDRFTDRLNGIIGISQIFFVLPPMAQLLDKLKIKALTVADAPYSIDPM